MNSINQLTLRLTRNILENDQIKTEKSFELFGNNKPSGWILKENSILIIQNSTECKNKFEAIKNLLSCSENVPEDLDVYCFLYFPVSEDQFDFHSYRRINGKLKIIKKLEFNEKMKNIFKNNSE